MVRVKKSYLLLSIASTAAVAPACGGDVKSHFTDPEGTPDGSTTPPKTGAGGAGPCGGHVCGVVVHPSGGSPNPSSDAGVHGVVVQPPPPASGGTGPCGGHVCGVVVMPSTGGVGGTSGAGGVAPCHPCGVVPIPGGTTGAGGYPPGSVPVPGNGGVAGAGGYFPGLIVPPPGTGGVHGVVVRPPSGGASGNGSYGGYGGYGNYGGYGSYGGYGTLLGIHVTPGTGGHS